MRRLKLDPGALDTELTVEVSTPVPDGMGGHAESWAMAGTVFAKVEPVTARQRFGADQTVETVRHRIFVRHRAELVSGMRLRIGARTLLIETVHDPDGTGRYLLCQTRETTP